VRGLRVDGICDESTWSALVEASYRLGDRELSLRRPMMRGDDVAVLQRTLGGLGFDAGRADGIFGHATAAAMSEFQRNVGLNVDGICGYETLAALRRCGGRNDGDADNIAVVRERESLLTQPRTLHGRRLVIGRASELATITRSVDRSLRAAGGLVLVVDHRDASEQARAANEFGADAYLGFASSADRCGVSFFATEGFRSPGGERLARHLLTGLQPILSRVSDSPSGMRLPILRETQMTAVVCELGPLSQVVLRAPLVSQAVVEALRAWVHEPVQAG
jgi:N-acetylmuramoyl-L-alanine amidase